MSVYSGPADWWTDGTDQGRTYIATRGIVQSNLVLNLDAGNTTSVPKTNLLTTWVDYAGNQANYEILGPYSIKLKNTTTGWIGYFPAAVSSTGKYVITFTYYSDSDGSSLVLDNDGIMDNAYNTTLTANITPQTYIGSVDVNTTGNILHWFRRNGGGNIYVTDVSYFKLETTWTDLSGNGNNGTLTNGPTYSNANGGSLVFDGADDYVSTSVNFGSSSQFTVSMFVNNTSRGAGDGQILSIGNEKLLFYTTTSTGPWAFSVYSPTIFSGIPRYTSTIMQLNTWYNLVGVYSGTAFEMFINGQSIYYTNTSISLYTLTTESVQIARRIGTGITQFPSTFATTQIYNRALTAAEILQNFNALRGRFGV